MNERGKPLLRKQLKRDQVAIFFANLPPCLIGMEAFSIAHYWARKLEALGHTVRLMAPQFVKPYVKSNKNYAADAEAMRVVSVARRSAVRAKTQAINQLRALLVRAPQDIREGL